MTAFSKYKGHISAQNTGLSILLTVCTKRLYLRDVCSREKGGQRKGKKKKANQTQRSRVKDTARISLQRKCILIEYTEQCFEL